MTETPINFSPQQLEAFDKVATWWSEAKHKNKLYTSERPQVFRLFGFAGTGKTTIAKHLLESLGIKRFHYCAFTGKAALVMSSKGCNPASTIHRLIYKPVINDETGEIERFEKVPKWEIFGGEGINFRGEPDYSPGYELILLDECSMVDETLAKDLLEYNVPILVLGDPGQLPPIKGSGFFVDPSTPPDVLLTEVHRQAEGDPILKLATLARKGGKPYLCDLGTTKVKRKNEVKTKDLLSYDQVLCGANKTRIKLNEAIRYELGRKSRFPIPGDKLIGLKNNWKNGILNGSMWSVVRVFDNEKSDDFIDLHLTDWDNPDEKKLVKTKVHRSFFDQLYPEPESWKTLIGSDQLTYGYAITCHKSQGSQWDKVYIQDESWMFKDTRSKWLYTAITRAAKELTIGIS